MVRKSFGFLRSGLSWLENKLVPIEARARAQRKDFWGIFALVAIVGASVTAACIGAYIFFGVIGGLIGLAVHLITRETGLFLGLLIIFFAWRFWKAPESLQEPEPPKKRKRKAKKEKEAGVESEGSIDGITSSF